MLMATKGAPHIFLLKQLDENCEKVHYKNKTPRYAYAGRVYIKLKKENTWTLNIIT